MANVIEILVVDITRSKTAGIRKKLKQNTREIELRKNVLRPRGRNAPVTVIKPREFS